MTDLRAASRRSSARSRAISPENSTGEPGAGGLATEGTGAHAADALGQGWKVSPSIDLPARSRTTIAEIAGSGRVTHIWLACSRTAWRRTVLRAWWDDAADPAIEVPLGDFFCQGWGRFAQVSSVPVAVNPHGGFNCYWSMPFSDSARIELENVDDVATRLHYQVDYELDERATDELYFHAQWRRSNPLRAGDTQTLIDIEGAGHYVGTYLAWGVRDNGWWGEGEVRFWLDGDEHPTINGTGTEDYFGGAWNFDVPDAGYTEFSTPYLGLPQVIRPDGLYSSQQRFGMHRWHLPDPIRFESRLQADVQALGWRRGGRYRLLQDDISATAFTYLDRPGSPHPEPPDAAAMDIDTGEGPAPI